MNPVPRGGARTREAVPRYRLAGAAADQILTLFGSPGRDRRVWAYYCYHHDVDVILEKAYEVHSRWRQGELRHDATRHGAFDRAMLHLDHPLPGTEYYLRPGDHGASAEALYRDVEVTPLWRRLWNNAVARLPTTGRRVLAALMVDFRTVPASRIAELNRNTVDRLKKQFQKFSVLVLLPGNAISPKSD